MTGVQTCALPIFGPSYHVLNDGDLGPAGSDYWFDPRLGSDKTFVKALGEFAAKTGHPELATVPWALWGHSAGGEFNYEFVCWKPTRVLAFVVNKGGYYFTHLAPAAARAVPGIFFIGGKDEAFRIQSIQGIVAVNLQAGATWKLVVEPDAGHEPGRTRERAVEFFAEVIARRQPVALPAQPASAPF